MNSTLRALVTELITQYSSATKAQPLVTLLEHMDMLGLCTYIQNTGGIYYWAVNMPKHPRII